MGRRIMSTEKNEMSVASAFVSDISLYFSNKDFLSDPKLIGSGFFADVYLIYNNTLNTNMAFKVPKSTQSINNFFQEIKLLKALENENILKFYGTCLYNGVFGYLTEFLDSGNLSSLIERNGRSLEWLTRVNIAKDIANGLVYLHDHHIVHRDLSAENILLNKLPSSSTTIPATFIYKAVIADFGLFLNMNNSRADHMSTVGNPFYTAPENLTNKSPYDYSSDVFSFGLLLCELITGLKNDPNQIPRTNNYGLDYKKLPVTSDCPMWIQGLACDCCMVHVSFRPTMRRACQIIVDNKQYIGLWHTKRFGDKSFMENNPFQLGNESSPTRFPSLSMSHQNYSQARKYSEPYDIPEENTNQDGSLLSPTMKTYRRIYRNNSVDSFLDPRLLNFAKAYKDPGYVDKPLTKCMKNLDPRKLARSTSESRFINRCKNSVSKLFNFH